MGVGRNSLLSTDRFMGTLQRCLKQCQECDDVGQLTDEQDAWKLEQLRHINDRIKLRRHGPAIQMDVTYQPEKSSKLIKYSVDMVPTIQIGEDDYYVAKPIKRQAPGRQRRRRKIEWRKSSSPDEKKRLLTLDEDNGCRKQVLRVLKVIRIHKPDLTPLTSYHFKTVLFRMTMTNDKEQWKWRSDCLGERLMSVLGQIEEELSKGVMPSYFVEGVNLLDGVKNINGMRGHLKNLRKKKKRIMKVLQAQ